MVANAVNISPAEAAAKVTSVLDSSAVQHMEGRTDFPEACESSNDDEALSEARGSEPVDPPQAPVRGEAEEALQNANT
jgi:hypothetical protein